MKKISLVLTALTCNAIGLIAQNNNATYHNSLEGVNTIVLSLSDEAILKTSEQNDYISIESNHRKKGFLLGWRERKKNSLFEINTFRKNDTLFIEDPKNMGATRGISFGAGERITTTIILPNNKDVIINKAGKLQINGQFEKLTTQNISRLELNDLNKKEFKTLVCGARKLKIDGEIKPNGFSYEGTGTKVYGLQAEKIVFNNFKFHH